MRRVALSASAAGRGLALALLASTGAGADASWQPLEVDVWDPPFNGERRRESGTYSALERASKPWRICVSIPHLKDAFWLAVDFAVVDEARRLGVAVRLRSSTSSRP